MPRVVSIDRVQVTQIQVVKDASGNLRVYAEYSLMSGSEVVKPGYRDMTERISAARKTAARSLFDAVVQDLTSIELA